MIVLQELIEQDIQNQILDWLNNNGIFSFRVNNAGIYDDVKKIYRTPGKFSLKGVSDIIGIEPVVVTQEMVGMTLGAFRAIEVKTKKGRATREQLAFLKKVEKLGGIGMIARSLDDVKKTLKESGSITP